MCGIAGKVDFSGAVDPYPVHMMCKAMEHRGPDERGFHHDGSVALGMQRLAIIDVHGGQQPIFNEDRSLAVVLNGEIYNFNELRADLIRRGHSFRSHVDTEVLVHLYEQFGEKMVDHLRGMFAFAIWDARKRSLFLARDRVGKKPLFWARRGSRFWFCSEVYALLRDPEIPATPNPDAINAYLAVQYVPHPLSAFKDIQKLPPASRMTVTATGHSIDRYWSLDYTDKLDGVPEPELVERLRGLLDDATRARLVSEVPLGAFLSGGVDSSAIVASMAKQMSEPVKTFSIGFSDEDFDELKYARIAAEHYGTDHHEFQVEPHALEIMPKLARHYGEPYGDPSGIPSFYLAELTKRHVTVALNGDGGDESFAGYGRYLSNNVAERFDWLPRPLRRRAPAVAKLLGQSSRDNSNRARAQRLARALALEPADRYAMWMSAFDSVRRERLLLPDFRAELTGPSGEGSITDAWHAASADELIDRMLAADVETYLPADLLVKMDIATMAYSVEARSPFLDHHVMEFAASLPADQKLRGTTGKRLLKTAMRGIVPDEILDRPKMGFGVPLARWFREDLRELPSEVLLDPRSIQRGYLRRDEVERLIKQHQDGEGDHSLRLWVLLQLEMWQREVVDTRREVAEAA
jgi:asparagine synthase (glutamine-hydrolysing)